ncbi:MAG: prohibitin family protein [Clostridiales bacterium]|nr:prohibitin family protein [Clostridiales bacterium]
MRKKDVFVDGEKLKNVSPKVFIAIVVVVIAAVLLSSAATVVKPGHSGVVVTLGKVSDNVLAEGFHLKVPFVQRVESISNQIKVCEVQNAEAVSKDLQAISSTIAVNYSIKASESDDIYRNIGNDYETSFLLPQIQESLKSISARYTAEELITLRAQVGQEIKETLQAKVGDSGIIIERFNIVNFTFSAEFNEAIEAKQVAEQNLIKTKTEQEQAIVIAEAEAKKKIIAAEAEASAITAKAEAQAEANRKLSESLNGTIVEYEKIQKWDGKLPQVTGGNALISFDTETAE